MPLYTSALTIEQYGISEVLNSTIEIVMPLASLCIIEALYRFSIDDSIDKQSAFVNALIIVLIGDFLVFILCLLIKHVFCYQYALDFALLYVSMTMYRLTTQFARGIGHVKRFVCYGVINSLVLVGSNIVLLVLLHGGVEEYLLSFSMGYGIAGIMALFFSREWKYLDIRKWNTKLLKDMVYYSIPSIPNMLSWWVNSLSDRYIMMYFWGAGIAGIYTAASKLPAMVNLVASMFQQAWQYSTAKEIEKRDNKDFFSNVFKIFSFICMILCSFLVLFNKLICHVLLKSDFYAAWRFVPFLLLAATLGCISTYFGTFYNAIKNNTMLMFSTIAGAIVNIILNFILIPQIGPLGAALATAISYAVITWIRITDVVRFVEVDINISKLCFQIGMVLLNTIVGSIYNSIISIIVGIVSIVLILYSDIELVKLLIANGRIFMKKMFFGRITKRSE